MNRPRLNDPFSSLAASILALPEGAACAGASALGVEFVDPDPADVPMLVREFCARCWIIAQCRQLGDELAPHRHHVIYGARYYSPGETVDGWEVAS